MSEVLTWVRASFAWIRHGRSVDGLGGLEVGRLLQVAQLVAALVAIRPIPVWEVRRAPGYSAGQRSVRGRPEHVDMN